MGTDGVSPNDRPRVRVYLKNVPYPATETDVARWCENTLAMLKIADVIAYQVVVPTWPSGDSKGFAFATLIFPNGVDRENWRRLDGEFFSGRRITAEESRGEPPAKRGRRHDDGSTAAEGAG